jgi:DNA helicase-2/ATP-dependent DNA helicase PcrA
VLRHLGELRLALARKSSLVNLLGWLGLALALDELVAASAAPTLAESIDLLLARVALSRSDGSAVDDRRVNLLTLHSTKGLEFSRVYIVGAEDAMLPGLLALENENQHEIQEARRLLYVGMTRAKDRLVLTRVGRRDGRGTGGCLFLREAGLEGGRRL